MEMFHLITGAVALGILSTCLGLGPIEAGCFGALWASLVSLLSQKG